MDWGEREQQEVVGVECGRAAYGTYQLDVVDFLLLERLDGLLSIQLQGEGQALQGLVLALHADLCLHLGREATPSVRAESSKGWGKERKENQPCQKASHPRRHLSPGSRGLWH